jgi:hypothetical protein
MGTRADFYVGRGPRAEWIGSIAWDGYPPGIQPAGAEWLPGQHLFEAETEAEYRLRVAHFFEDRTDVTLPEQGWPWPWDNSETTDYAYAFDDGRVWAHCCCWFDPQGDAPGEDHACPRDGDFPDMSERKNVTLGPRSGVMVFGVRAKE